MAHFRRNLEPHLLRHLRRGKSLLLLGPRQVGKTTLLSTLSADLNVNLVDRTLRLSYERRPQRLLEEVSALPRKAAPPLVIIDEVQKVPEIMDVAQQLIDAKHAQFILTGSSARKLRRHGDMNLLPGRLVHLRLDPLTLDELPEAALDDLVYDGSLPGCVQTLDAGDRELDLKSYVEAYLDEEVRAEALVRRIGDFARFLELAGIESGNIINLSAIASDVGLSKNTVGNYFEILFDCLVAERIDPITRSATRKKLTRSSRFLLFDMGVRRLCANEGRRVTPERRGGLFEQFVGLELIRHLRFAHPTAQLRFWRDPDGPEVDWVVEVHGRYVPIEVKWSDDPGPSVIKHVLTFLDEYQDQATHGYVVCRSPTRLQLHPRVTAIPWQHLPRLVAELES